MGDYHVYICLCIPQRKVLYYGMNHCLKGNMHTVKLN